MTKNQLLENLNKTNETPYEKKSFKVIASFDHKRFNSSAKIIHILASDEYNELETYLVYRLDLNYLTNAFHVDGSRLSSRELKQYEEAIDKE